MEALYIFETSVSIDQSTPCNIPEDLKSSLVFYAKLPDEILFRKGITTYGISYICKCCLGTHCCPVGILCINMGYSEPLVLRFRGHHSACPLPLNTSVP